MNKIEYIGKCLLIRERKKKILVVGDLHLGYEEYMNKTGVFVSRQMFDEMISYFDGVFAKVGKVEQIVLLGDVKHDFGSITKQEWNDVLKLFGYLGEECEEIAVARGNHDRILEPIVRKNEKVILRDYFIEKKFAFLHGDKSYLEVYDKNVKYWVIGHGHPAVKISDGVKVEKYKCFLVGKYKGRKIIVVPSFLEVSEGSDPRENNLGLAWNFNLDKFEVKIVSGDDLKVMDFGLLKEL